MWGVGVVGKADVRTAGDLRESLEVRGSLGDAGNDTLRGALPVFLRSDSGCSCAHTTHA